MIRVTWKARDKTGNILWPTHAHFWWDRLTNNSFTPIAQRREIRPLAGRKRVDTCKHNGEQLLWDAWYKGQKAVQLSCVGLSLSDDPYSQAAENSAGDFHCRYGQLYGQLASGGIRTHFWLLYQQTRRLYSGTAPLLEAAGRIWVLSGRPRTRAAKKETAWLHMRSHSHVQGSSVHVITVHVHAVDYIILRVYKASSYHHMNASIYLLVWSKELTIMICPIPWSGIKIHDYIRMEKAHTCSF